MVTYAFVIYIAYVIMFSVSYTYVAWHVECFPTAVRPLHGATGSSRARGALVFITLIESTRYLLDQAQQNS